MSTTYKKFFDESVRNLDKNINKKLKDSNTLKSNVVNPHYRAVTLTNIPRLTFAYKYGKNFSPDEKLRATDAASFRLRTLARLQYFFKPESLFKIHSSNDYTLICPWVKLVADMTVVFADGKKATFEEGKLGIPLYEDDKKFFVFFVCGGLDHEDNIPAWVVDKSPGNLLLSTPPSMYHKHEGVGQISVNKKDHDLADIPGYQDICDGDFIKIRSEIYQVLGRSKHWYNPNLDSIRFTKPIKKNANNAPYSIIKPPCFKGNIAWISKSAVDMYRGVDIILTKLDENNFGHLEIKFQNACFNIVGFLTHDTAV